MSVLYRPVTIADTEKIVRLHTDNWRIHYRGILDDYYLDNQVFADRKRVWNDRLRNPDPQMRLLVAERAGELVGFGCMFLEESKEFGALLDNLHVRGSYGGMGIGRILMQLLAKEIKKSNGRQDMYLWVLKKNTKAIKFYQKLKGIQKEVATEEEIGNNPAKKIRYYWPNVTSLINF